MSDAHGVARDQLRAFIERIERLEEEKKTIADDIKDVYGEAKGMGFDTVILKRVITLRKKDEQQRLEEEAILATYMHALGMIDQPDFFYETPSETKTSVGGGRGSAAPLRMQPETATEMHPRPSINDKPCSKEGLQANPSPAGTGSELLAGREGRHEGEEASVDLPTNSEFDPTEDRSEGQSLDGGLNAVGANTGGRHVDGSAVRADTSNTAGGTVSNPPAKPLRPHCLRPQNCGGYGSNHCFSCKKAAKAHEHEEEAA